MKSRKFLPALGVVATAAILLAGCTVDGAPSDDSTDTDTSNVSQAVLDAVEQGKALPEFTAPGDPIDISSLKGKKVFVIPSAPVPFIQAITDAIVEVGEETGMDLTVYENQAQVSQWVQGIDRAIADDADIIILSGSPDPRALQPQLQAAEEAGIPVVVGHFHDDSTVATPDCEGCNGGVTGLVTAPFYTAGKAAADWIIADSNGEANVLLVGGSDVLPSAGTVDAMNAEFEAECPDCSTTEINIPVADWGTKTQSEIQSALTKDPTIDYVYVLYDAMVAGAVPAIETLGRAGQVKVAGYNGSPFALDFIRDGDVVAMNVGEDTAAIGYATMDQAFRIMLGEPTVETRTPIRIWDDTNITEAGDPAAPGVGYGSAYVDGYRALWGL
ncbi:sugar ABC transporter substrate-binding protein [Homoserinibacter sp. GY 40078]|uniref:sugar ABC transporter substrate-binding protein n=1 Tax=Homoserinibacter sp. GY 40078 TaxID=2603275 RepID=UPI0011CBC095|nr:sugar ABC transporter substrate-binding protein [Homoserinibacter sp. GY 40078]TXK19101.1 sugar ABC transporter substrate-binding protein [Homoserinibacter sp. GY 40078]